MPIVESYTWNITQLTNCQQKSLPLYKRGFLKVLNQNYTLILMELITSRMVGCQSFLRANGECMVKIIS